MSNQFKKSVIWGVVGGLCLLIIFGLILTIVNSLSHAFEQFRALWYWMLILIVGFSVQVGLYAYSRMAIKQKKLQAGAGKELAGSSTVSTVSMVACCAHHLVDFLPILGLSAAFLFLAQYQVWFIILGIVSNLFGIILMLQIIKKHSLYQDNGILSRQLNRFNLKQIRNVWIACSLIILIIAFLAIKYSTAESVDTTDQLKSDPAQAERQEAFQTDVPAYPPKSNDAGGLSIEIKPIAYELDEPWQFEVSFNTHQGSLDFDLMEQAILIDDQGHNIKPFAWQGGSGGHHLSGILIFPPLLRQPNSITIKIADVYDVPERLFIWVW